MTSRSKKIPTDSTAGSSSLIPTQISPEFMSRPVNPGRLVDFEFFEKEGFGFPSKLTFQGWRYLFRKNVPFYPQLVREFYQNFSFEGQEAYSTVLGKRINLSIEFLGNALLVPSEGLCDLDGEDKCVVKGTILCRNDISASRTILVKDVSVDTRVLHHLVANAIIPKIGRFDMFSDPELYLVHHILAEIPVCLPYILLNEMKRIVLKKNSFLPFGIFLTHVFKAAGLNLEKEFSKSVPKVQMYDDHSLHRMGINKRNGQWVRTRSLSIQAAVSSADQSSSDSSSSSSYPTHRSGKEPATESRSSKSFLLNSIQSITATLASIQKDQKNVLSQINHLQFDVRHVEDSQYKLQDLLQSFVAKSTPKSEMHHTFSSPQNVCPEPSSVIPKKRVMRAVRKRHVRGKVTSPSTRMREPRSCSIRKSRFSNDPESAINIGDSDSSSS